MNGAKILLWIAVGAVAGIAGYSWLAGGDASPGTIEGTKAEPKPLYWVAPMDPNFRRDSPGKSPMGMALVPVYPDKNSNADQKPGIRVAPEVVQNLGIRSAEVKRVSLPRSFDSLGHVTYDDDRITHVHPRVSGWIEHLAVHSLGAPVAAGDLLFELYSRELVVAQEELISVLAQGNKHLIGASQARLRALGMPEKDLTTLSRDRKVQKRVRIYAPHAGVVTKLGARHGMYVTPANEVMTLVDLSEVWVRVEVFARHADWVAEGDQASLTLPYLPGKTWQAQVDYIYPELDSTTLTLPVRLRVKNPDRELRPGMYAQASIHGKPLEHVLTVPRAAVIRGKTPRVVEALAEGRFLAREVEIGRESGDQVEILRGLKEGMKVVISGQFLLDSEASLAGALLRLNADHFQADSAIDHSQHEGQMP